MNIIHNDPFVSPINCAQMALIRQVTEQYPIKEDVELFETVHGHIAMLNFKKGHFIPFHKESAARLDAESLKFWSHLAPKLRWFEVGHGTISIAF